MKNDPVKSFTLFRRYAKLHEKPILVLTTVYIVSTALLVLAPQTLRVFIDSVHDSSPLMAQVLAIALYLAAMLAQAMMAALLDYQLVSVGQRITDNYRRDVMSHYLSLSAQHLSGFRSGEMLTRLGEDTQGLFTYYYILFYKLAGSVLALAAILAVLCTRSLLLCAVLAAVSILSILGFRIIQTRDIPKSVRRAKASAEFNGLIKELLDNSPSLRALGAENYAESRTQAAMRKRFHESLPAGFIYANLWSAATIMQSLVVGSGLLIAALMWDSHSITLGTVYLIYTYSALIISPLQDFRNHMGKLQAAKAGITRTQDFLNIPLAVQSGGSSLGSGALGLSIKDLSFAYENGPEVLSRVSFSARAGERIGIMGETGCGKSTLLSLIARLNSFDSGMITLGGFDIREIEQRDFREKVAYCTQRVQLIHGTLRDNITLFSETYTDDEIEEAAALLGLSGWLREFPGGLDTHLEMGEANLSSGEAQLLAIVRLFLKQPGLVLLDEISSNLDAAAEKRVLTALKAMCEGRTVIAIAHKAESLSWMDSILHMKDGALFRQEEKEGSI